MPLQLLLEGPSGGGGRSRRAAAARPRALAPSSRCSHESTAATTHLDGPLPPSELLESLSLSESLSLPLSESLPLSLLELWPAFFSSSSSSLEEACQNFDPPPWAA